VAYPSPAGQRAYNLLYEQWATGRTMRRSSVYSHPA
jgi:hypothetical protein